MLSSIPREAQAYADLYHGKTLALKVSGAEIDGPDFSALAEDIRDLTQRGVKIVLVYGGGEQINQAYRTYTNEPRQKIDGVGVTTTEVLEHGVMPAYRSIQGKIRHELPDATFVEPDKLICETTSDSRYGLVGVPKELILPEADVSVVGFVGTVNGKEHNVNADDVVMHLAQEYRDRIEELILLTGSGGVLDTKGNVVSLLTDTSLDAILAGTHHSVQATDGMLKKLREVRRALDVVGKVVITKTSALERELLQYMGDGTLCADSKKMQASRMHYTEGPIFDAVLAEHTRAGIFRQRSADEVERLKMNHQMLRIKQSPLGGFSAVPNGRWLELSAVWAGTIGNGVGRMVMDAAILHANNRPMYALSRDDDAIAAFKRHKGFESFGPLQEAMSAHPEKIPEPLRGSDSRSELFIATSTS